MFCSKIFDQPKHKRRNEKELSHLDRNTIDYCNLIHTYKFEKCILADVLFCKMHRFKPQFFIDYSQYCRK